MLVSDSPTLLVSRLLTSHGYTCQSLNGDHFVADFDCGHGNQLGSWLSDHGHTYHNENLCRVWVIAPVDRPGEVHGFFTLSAHSVNVEDINRSMRRDDPANGNVVNALPQLPAQLLGKMARSQEGVPPRFGALLLACVYANYLAANDVTASKFLVADAREPQLIDYYVKNGFVPSQAVRGGLKTLYKPTKSIERDLTMALSYQHS